MLPSKPFRLKFIIPRPELLNKEPGISPDILLLSRLSVERTGMLPIQAGTEPEIRFIDKSKSASRFMPDIDPGIDPVSWFLLSNARLSIFKLPKSAGSEPETWLLLISRCFKLANFVREAGIAPDIWLSARFNTVSLCRFPIPEGIVPEILFPTRSKILKELKVVTQSGMEPETPFQSAIMRLVSLSSWQILGFMEPVMYPDRPAFSKMGSSDSPRRLMSATRPVVGSQLIPYQPEQQLVPVHVLKIPKSRSVSEELKASNAARSAGGQAWTVEEVRTKKRTSVTAK